MTWLRSLFFRIYFYATVCFFATLCFLSYPFPYAIRFRFAKMWDYTMLWGGRVICGLEYKIEGEENISDGPSVILIKHTTVFETYAQLAVFSPQTWVLECELKWIPLFGWVLASMRPIAIDRGAGRSAITQVIEQGKALLADGVWISIFPEDTRMPLGETKRYGISGTVLGKEAGLPDRTGSPQRRRFVAAAWSAKKPELIRYCIGPQIDARGCPPKETNLFVLEWIESKMREISIGYKDKMDCWRSCRALLAYRFSRRVTSII